MHPVMHLVTLCTNHSPRMPHHRGSKIPTTSTKPADRPIITQTGKKGEGPSILLSCPMLRDSAEKLITLPAHWLGSYGRSGAGLRTLRVRGGIGRHCSRVPLRSSFMPFLKSPVGLACIGIARSRGVGLRQWRWGSSSSEEAGDI